MNKICKLKNYFFTLIVCSTILLLISHNILYGKNIEGNSNEIFVTSISNPELIQIDEYYKNAIVQMKINLMLDKDLILDDEDDLIISINKPKDSFYPIFIKKDFISFNQFREIENLDGILEIDYFQTRDGVDFNEPVNLTYSLKDVLNIKLDKDISDAYIPIELLIESKNEFSDIDNYNYLFNDGEIDLSIKLNNKHYKLLIDYSNNYDVPNYYITKE